MSNNVEMTDVVSTDDVIIHSRCQKNILQINLFVVFGEYSTAKGR